MRGKLSHTRKASQIMNPVSRRLPGMPWAGRYVSGTSAQEERLSPQEAARQADESGPGQEGDELLPAVVHGGLVIWVRQCRLPCLTRIQPDSLVDLWVDHDPGNHESGPGQREPVKPQREPRGAGDASGQFGPREADVARFLDNVNPADHPDQRLDGLVVDDLALQPVDDLLADQDRAPQRWAGRDRGQDTAEPQDDLRR